MHVDAGMGFVHVIAAVPVKPFAGVACKLNVAVSPAVIVVEVDPPAPTPN